MKVCSQKSNAFARSRLGNNFFKNRIEKTRFLYTKQRNKCVSILRNAKMEYYENLNAQIVQDNEQFWKTKISRFQDIR